MFGTIRRHQQWLWIIIISLTILSFVIFFSPYQRVSSTHGGQFGAVCYLGNRSVSSEEFDMALREVLMEFLCNNGFLPDVATMRQFGFDPEQRTILRLAMIEKAKELNLHAGDTAAQRLAASMVNRFRRQGINSYRDFLERVLTQERHRFSEADFQRFVRHELVIQQLGEMNGLSGILVTPQEAEEIYRRQNEPIETLAAIFHASNYLANVKDTPEALSEFYTNNMARYRIGERAVLDYISFPGSNFLSEADAELDKNTNLTQVIDATYLQRGTNDFPDAKTPEEAKAMIKEEYRKEVAALFARRAANQFVTQVFAQETNRLQHFHDLAAASNLVVRATDPFEIETDEGPKEFTVPADFTNLLGRLTLENPVASSTIPTKEGAYLIALVRRIPSENPSFESIRERVTEDYRQHEALLAAQAAGAAAAATIRTNLTAGKSFEDACAAAGTTPVKLPPFAASSRSEPEIEKHVSLGLLRNVALAMAPGETSDFISMPEGGFVLQLVRRLPIDPERMKNELPQFMVQMRQARMNEALNGWFRKLYESGYIQLPQSEMKQPAGTPPPSPG